METITLSCLNGSEVTVEVESGATASDVRKKAAAALGTSAAFIKLIVNEEAINDKLLAAELVHSVVTVLVQEEPNMSDVREAFVVVDTNGDGIIDSKELKDALSKFGLEPKKENIQHIIAEFDDDGAGVIVFEAFTRLMKGEMGMPFKDGPHGEMTSKFAQALLKSEGGSSSCLAQATTMETAEVVLGQVEVHSLSGTVVYSMAFTRLTKVSDVRAAMVAGGVGDAQSHQLLVLDSDTLSGDLVLCDLLKGAGHSPLILRTVKVDAELVNLCIYLGRCPGMEDWSGPDSTTIAEVLQQMNAKTFSHHMSISLGSPILDKNATLRECGLKGFANVIAWNDNGDQTHDMGDGW